MSDSTQVNYLAIRAKRQVDITNAFAFLVPLLELEKMLKDTFQKGYGENTRRLFNAYLYDLDIPNYRSGYIFLVHHNYQDLHFGKWEENFRKLPNCVNSYDIADTFFGIKVLKFPDKFMNEYNLFLQGKYSKFSSVAKALINKYHIKNQHFKFATDATYKIDSLRLFWEDRINTSLSKNAEYWSAPILEKEILTSVIKDKMVNI